MTPQSHRLSSACHRHPSAPVTGFCALCLSDRLADHHPPPPPPRSTLSDLFTRERPHQQTKTVKEFIDLELHRRHRNAATHSRTFWNAASHRFKKWKSKRASRKTDTGAAIVNVESRRRETQSEVGDCNLGRTSCDTDPRLSVDARRISFDCPRASWDGCLLGKACTRLSPMEEDSNSSDSVGLHSSGDGRRSFCVDRSNSRRRRSIAGLHELKLMSNANANANSNSNPNANGNGNAKVSPATFYGAKLLITEKELMEGYVRPSGDAVKSDCVIESDSSGVRQKGFNKLQKWRGVWNKLGLVQRKEDKLAEDDCDSRDVADNKPIAESLQRLRRVVNVQPSEPVGHKLMRSYSVSCASPCRMDGLAEDSESKGGVLNGRQGFMFQRNRSVRHSPINPDTGLLRFYLTPSKSYKRSKAGRSSVKDLNSVARSGL